MIEEALTAAIVKAAPGVTVWPVGVPENVSPPFVAYREVNHDEEVGHSTISHTTTFEIQVAASKGLEPNDYAASKTLARQIAEALRYGFDEAGMCIYTVIIDRGSDRASREESVFWHQSNYSLTYDTESY